MLLSNKVLDDPRQRRLFKTSDLVELFNLNEPIDGEACESDRLFRESKLQPATSGFSLSKIQEMRKLASALSKKISATNIINKSARDESKETSDGAREDKHDEQNNNLKCNETSAMENDSSENQTSCSQQVSTQESPSEDVSSIENVNPDLRKRSDNIEDNNASKDNSKVDVTPTNITNDDPVEKEKSKSVSSDDKVVELPHTRKHKKSRRKERGKVSAMFEGERVSCLIGRRLARSNEKEQPLMTTDDDYVLRKLFAKSSKTFFYRFKIAFLRN